MAEVPAIRITAVDQASQVIGQVTRSLAGFASAVLSVGAVVDSMRRALNLGDDLKRMADTTGIAVDKLDQLSIVAKLNGATLDDMAKAFKFLGGSMIEAQAAGSQSAKLFSALGVAVKDAQGNLRGVDDVMGDTAKALASIENETVRAAAGTAIFGKSYLAIAASLRNYSEDQERANLVLEKYGGVSETAARLSDKLTDQITMLGEGSKRALLGALVPGLAAASQALDELTASGGRFQGAFGTLVSAAIVDVSQDLVRFEDILKRVSLIVGAMGSLDGLKTLRAQWSGLAAEREAAIARIGTAARFPGLDDGDQVSRAAAAQDRLNKKQADSAAIARIVAPAQKEVADVYGDLVKQLEMTIAKQQDLSELEKMLMTLDDKRYASLTAEQRAHILGLVDALDALKREEAATKKAIEADKETFEWMEKIKKSYDDSKRAVDEYVSGLQFEIQTMQMSDRERQVAIALRELERRGISLTKDELDAYAASVVAAVETKAALQQQIDLWQGIEGAAHDAFLHIFEGGKSVFDRLVDSLKSGLLELLYQMTVKKWIIQIGAEVSGNPGILGGVAGTANAAGSLASLFGGGFGGGGGLLGAAGGFGGAQTAAMDSFLIGNGITGLGGLTTALGPVVAALPYAAIAAIAIPLIVKAFDKGPASRTGTFASGAASLISDPSRDAVFQGSSAFGAFGIAKDFWLGPEAGAAFKPTLDAITQLDNTIAGMVGADATGAISAALAQHSITVGLGKEGTDLNASGGPGAILKDRYVTVLTAINKELGAVVANFGGTGEDLANLVVGLVSLNENLTAATDGFGGINAELEKAADRTAMDVFREQGQALDKLMENFDGSTAATLGLVHASNAYYNTAVALMAQIRDITKSIDVMFAGTRENIYLAGRDNDFVYQYLQQQADAKTGLLATLTDPAAIAKTASEINDMVVKAFGLLDPGSQSALRDQFLAGIDQVNAAADARLAELGTTVGSAAKSDLQQVKELLADFVKQFSNAADKIDTGGDKILAGAQTPVQVSVMVTDATGQEVYSGGGG